MSNKKASPKLTPQTFAEAAKDFEKSKIEGVIQQNNLLKKLVIGAFLIAALAVLAMCIAILARKEPEPYVLKVDNSTGYSEVMRSIKDSSDTYDEVTNRFWLATYIRTCETYDWFTISHNFEACKLMSDKSVEEEYTRNVYSPSAPLAMLKDKGKIAVNITSITLFGNTAAIRFTTQKLNPNGDNTDNSPIQKKIATATFHFVSGYMTDQQRLINPLGFKVVSYKVDSEATQ